MSFSSRWIITLDYICSGAELTGECWTDSVNTSRLRIEAFAHTDLSPRRFIRACVCIFVWHTESGPPKRSGVIIMATCAVIYPSSSLMLLLLLFRPLHGGSYAPFTDRSGFTDSIDLPVNSTAESTSWEEVSVPESSQPAWRTFSPGTDSLSTPGLSTDDRRLSPSVSSTGPGRRNRTNHSITLESWIRDSQHKSTYISSTGEVEPLLTNSTVVEKNDLTPSSILVTDSSQNPSAATTSRLESEESITFDSEPTDHSYSTISPREISSTELFVSKSHFLKSAVVKETSRKGEELENWHLDTTSEGADNLERLLSTSPGVSEEPLYTVPYVLKIPLNTLPVGSKRYLSTELDNPERSVSTSINDSEVFSILQNISEKFLNSTQNYTNWSSSTSLKDSERRTLTNVFKILPNFSQSKTDRTLSTLPNYSKRSNTSINDVKRSVSTLPNDSKTATVGVRSDSGWSSTLINAFSSSSNSSPSDTEEAGTTLNDLTRSSSTLSNDSKMSTIHAQNASDRSTTLINIFENPSNSSSDTEISSTLINDFIRSVSTLPNDSKISTVSAENDSEWSSMLINDFENYLNSSPSDTEGRSTTLNDLKRSLSASSNDSKMSTIHAENSTESSTMLINIFQSPLNSSRSNNEISSTLINNFKRSVSTLSNDSNMSTVSAQNDSEWSSTLINAFENYSNSSPSDTEGRSTTLNDMKRSLNTSPNDSKTSTIHAENASESSTILTSIFQSPLNSSRSDTEMSSTLISDFKRSVSTFPNDSNMSTVDAQNDSEWSSTLINVSENYSNSSPNDSARSSISMNDFKRSLSTSPNDSKISTNSVHNASESSNTLTTAFESSSNSSLSDTARSLSTSPNYFKRSLSTSLKDSEKWSSSPNVSESTLIIGQNDSESSLSASLNDSKSSLGSTPNNSENPFSTSLSSYEILNTTTNSSEETTHSHSTSKPMDFDNITHWSDAVKSPDSLSSGSVYTQTNGSTSTSDSILISDVESITAITASSHSLPRTTDDILNTTVLSEMYSITNLIATALSSVPSGSEGIVNDFTVLSSNFTATNSSKLGLVEAATNGFLKTQFAKTTTSTNLRRAFPERPTDSPRTSLPPTKNVYLSFSTMESPIREVRRTSSAPIVITSRPHTGLYPKISQVPTDTPKPELIGSTDGTFTTIWASPTVFMNTSSGDKRTDRTKSTTAIMKTSEPVSTRTSVSLKFLTSTRSSASTRTSAITRMPVGTTLLTSTKISESTTIIPIRTSTSTKPHSPKGAITPEPTVIQVTSTSTPETSAVSADVDECLSNPCPSRAKCVNNLGSFTCKCYPGYYLEKGTRCTLARTFAGIFYSDNKSHVSRMQDLQSEILKMVNASLFSLNGYYTSVIADLSETEGSVSILNMFVLPANVTAPEVLSSVHNYMESCRYKTGSCQFVLNHQLSYKAEKLCSLKVPECDNATAECSDHNGIADCQCKDGYFKYNTMDPSCRACDDGYKLENGTCAPCMFGFGGFNCKSPYKLITVVIAAAGGGLLLILGIALTITCCRKDKNDISKLIFKSADFQRSPYAEFPKNPRISVEWGRETIEMQENGSTKNLLQMTDVYYSSGLRGSEVDRNGMHPYSGLPGSRYSCIYTGQYNPSFSSEETRRRDYF
ncbi:protein HEG isoform X2 [Stegostoma tigrinum]|uniref:protein HEG isoform X2 n=1 Tax=Stegostoma tigrinum TaxID=3053191 RepID=UPI002870109F|nr:protein HEG isoform X2 [Stegostoma tigrinum]